MSNEVKRPPEVDIAKLVADITKSVMDQALPAVASAFAANQPKPQAYVDPRGAPNHGEVCGVCRQYVKACEGKHVDLCVYPSRYPEFGEFFQGCRINGVTYLSNDESHTVPVPANAAPYIQQMIEAFANNERETRIGRKKIHNSGNLHAPNPAQVGWR